MIHFSSVSDFPLFSKNWKNFSILLFPEKILYFHPPKFLMIFFCHQPQIFKFPPYFLCFSTFAPRFHENYYFPPLPFKIPLCFTKLDLLLHTFCVFRFPPTLTMMHLCITQCTYWTPLAIFHSVDGPK